MIRSDDFLPILCYWKLEKFQEWAILAIVLEENWFYSPICLVYSREVGITRTFIWKKGIEQRKGFSVKQKMTYWNPKTGSLFFFFWWRKKTQHHKTNRSETEISICQTESCRRLYLKGNSICEVLISRYKKSDTGQFTRILLKLLCRKVGKKSDLGLIFRIVLAFTYLQFSSVL